MQKKEAEVDAKVGVKKDENMGIKVEENRHKRGCNKIKMYKLGAKLGAKLG